MTGNEIAFVREQMMRFTKLLLKESSAPLFLVGQRVDDAGHPHVTLCTATGVREPQLIALCEQFLVKLYNEAGVPLPPGFPPPLPASAFERDDGPAPAPSAN